MNLYNEIFRRKSFHRFTNTIPFSDSDLNLINDTITNVTPLDKNIKTSKDAESEVVKSVAYSMPETKVSASLKCSSVQLGQYSL